jgi:hypothetical protein
VLFDKLANSISASMGGTSGALLEIFFRAAATFFSNKVGAHSHVMKVLYD